MSLEAKWVEGTGDDIPEDKWVGWVGGLSSNPTWEDYIARLDDDHREVAGAVRRCHERDGLDIYGEDMDTGYFLLTDGRAFQCSWRAWGDLRQAMVGKREGYMRYYANYTR